MQNMEKYFGFKVKVTDFLQPEDYHLLRGRIDEFVNSERIDINNYHIYLHQLVITAEPHWFGLGGGLPSRVTSILLKFSVNKKQRETGHIRFMNHVFHPEMLEQIKPYYMPHEICYTIPPEYFVQMRYFQNVIITFVSREIRDDYKKIKVCVSANPTSQFLDTLKNKFHADSFTNLDLSFEKGIDFEKQIEIQLDNPSSKSDHGRPRSVTNVTFNVGQAGVVASDSNVSNVANINKQIDPILRDHVLKELRNLHARIEAAGFSEKERKDVETLQDAINSGENGQEFLPKLKEVGKWVLDKADKIGLTLATAALKNQLGL